MHESAIAHLREQRADVNRRLIRQRADATAAEANAVRQREIANRIAIELLSIDETISHLQKEDQRGQRVNQSS